MTRSRNRSSAVAPDSHRTQPIAKNLARASEPQSDGHQPAALPPKIQELGKFETDVREQLNRLAKELGEDSIGGAWRAQHDGHFNTTSELESIGAEHSKYLIEELKESSRKLGSRQRIRLLVYLWRECWKLWDLTLAYRTLQFVAEATAQTVQDATASGAGEQEEGWEGDAWRAAGMAMRLITADADVFQQINLSSAEGLAEAAKMAVEATELTLEEVGPPLAALGSRAGESDDDSDQIAEGLRDIESTARQNQIFYAALEQTAEALIKFETWLAAAPRLGSAQPRPAAADSPRSHPPGEELLASINAAIDQVRRAQAELGGLILSRCEPWERLLIEIYQIVTLGENTGVASQILIPKRVSIRYCYPFAVEANEQSCRLDKLRKKDLSEAFNALRLQVSEPKLLAPTEFFAQGPGLYGGVRIDLPDIEFRRGQMPGVAEDGRRELAKVWIDLSNMGNHCLCVQPEPLYAPAPHLLYRALRAGTPFVLGETVVLAQPSTDKKPSTDREVAWDDLQLFSRDVIEAIAGADFWHIKTDLPIAEPFVRGNGHAIVVVRTDAPLGTRAEEIADVLDNAVGGRILLRSIQRGATTLEEWVRYPPVPRPGSQDRAAGIADMPEMGLAGDWCAHTGETTVFGIVAAPSWHSDVYTEAAQFASSWSPLLRMWSRRLLKAIQTSEPGTDQGNDADQLRRIERQIRSHLVQINAEELCATLAHRRFLDQILEMAGLDRVQRELEAQLEAAEHLTDWFSERARREADERRQKLLGIIALFGLFELGTFLSLANSTGFHERFLFLKLHQGVWEDWLMLAMFVLALLVGVYLFNTRVGTWVRKHLGAMVRSRASASG